MSPAEGRAKSAPEPPAATTPGWRYETDLPGVAHDLRERTAARIVQLGFDGALRASEPAGSCAMRIITEMIRCAAELHLPRDITMKIVHGFLDDVNREKLWAAAARDWKSVAEMIRCARPKYEQLTLW